MPNKSFVRSKTFWVNLLALVSMASPEVRQWIANNPVEFTAAWSSLNIVLRFATSGKVSLSGPGGPGEPKGGGFFPWVLLGLCLLGVGTGRGISL